MMDASYYKGKRCVICNIKLKPKNTSVSSLAESKCIYCHTDELERRGSNG